MSLTSAQLAFVLPPVFVQIYIRLLILYYGRHQLVFSDTGDVWDSYDGANTELDNWSLLILI